MLRLRLSDRSAPDSPPPACDDSKLTQFIDLILKTGRKHSIPQSETLKTLRLLQEVRAENASPSPEHIGTAPEEPNRTVLLWCPQQGGWHTGQWQSRQGCWVSTAAPEKRLQPTLWMDAPPQVS
jgi:hypothetical protein